MKKVAGQIAFAWSPLLSATTPDLRGTSIVRDTLLYTVPISPRLSDSKDCMLLSIAASPGRYLEVLYQRVIPMANGRCKKLVLLNPSALPDPTMLPERVLAIQKALQTARIDKSSLRIWVARGSEKPLAYEIPVVPSKDATDVSLAFRHFSTCNAGLDSAVFSRLCKIPVTTAQLTLGLNDHFESASSLSLPGTDELYRRQAIHLLGALFHHGPKKGLEDPLFLMPYEAGDLLFFSLALKDLGILKPSVMTLDRFSPILKAILPAARTFRVTSPLSDTERRNIPELQFFKNYIFPSLPPGRSFVFLRPQRSFWPTQAHLIDQFRFALGHDLRSESDASNFKQLRSLLPPARKPPLGTRILCHFEGGWNLKQYPMKWRLQLIDLLKKQGFHVTVLTGTKIPNIKCVPFTTLSALDKLISESGILIGVDSFPLHYASLVAGIPTIALFGSTRVSCSYLADEMVIALERGIECNPCGEPNQCQRYFGSFCMNYPLPEEIAEAAGRLKTRSVRTRELPRLEKTLEPEALSF